VSRDQEDGQKEGGLRASVAGHLPQFKEAMDTNVRCTEGLEDITACTLRHTQIAPHLGMIFGEATVSSLEDCLSSKFVQSSDEVTSRRNGLRATGAKNK
jgi:hypothetical protein